MKPARSPVEKQQILMTIEKYPSFVNCFTNDWTDIVLKDLFNRMYGKIPRNFLVNISGLIGTPSGIFKSSMGLQIALKLDPTFDLKKRVAFSVNKLLDKLNKNTEYYLCK